MKNRVLSFLLALIMLVAMIPAEGVSFVVDALESTESSHALPMTEEGGALTPSQFELSYVSWEEAEEEKRNLLGSGTESDPYLIYSPEAFCVFASLINDGGSEKVYAELCVNIDFGCRKWTPVGYSANVPFCGVFDGKNHEIVNTVIGYDSGKNLDTEEYFVGFFGYARNAIIRNLGLSCYEIDQKYTYDLSVGALVAHAEGTQVSNCYAKGRITTSFDESILPFERKTVVYYDLPDVINPIDKHGVGAVLDLRDLPSDSSNTVVLYKRVVVGGDVSSLKIIGDPSKKYQGLYVSVMDHEVFDISMELENVNAFGSINGSNVNNRCVYLKSSGQSNSLENMDTLCFDTTRVVITGEADLTIKGMNGYNGEDASSSYEYALRGGGGGNGHSAGYFRELVIAADATVSFIGGNGGNGGMGGIGSPGVNGHAAPGTGGIGGWGGNGGVALNKHCKISVMSGILCLKEGNGGAGGQGGQGGTGYQGSAGGDAYRGGFLGIGWHYGEDGGTGGEGGLGGTGGNGGSGSKQSYSDVTVYENGKLITYSGIDGAGGRGGQGGTGGIGGVGGSCDLGNACKAGQSNCNCGGKGGNGGKGGKGGKGGNGSTAGPRGEAGIGGTGGVHSTSLIACYCVGSGWSGAKGAVGDLGSAIGVASSSIQTITGSTETPTLYEGVFVYATLAVGGIVGVSDAESSIERCVAVLDEPSCEGRRYGLIAGEAAGNLINVLAACEKNEGYEIHDASLWLGTGTIDEKSICQMSVLMPDGLYACVDEQGLVFDSGIGSDNTVLTERTVYNFLGKTVEVAVPAYVFGGRFIGEVKAIEQFAFAQNGGSMRKVFLGEFVDTVKNGILQGCFRLEEIGIGSMLASIPEYERGEHLFGLEKYKRESVGALRYTVCEGNERFGSDEYGVLYEVMSIPFDNGEKICPLAVIDAPKNADLSNYSIPEHVVEIKPYAFAYNKNLKKVDLRYVMTVDDCAFYQATGLEEVLFSAPSSDDEYVRILDEMIKKEHLTATRIIGDRAFYGCTSLKIADLSGASVLSIGNDAFADCGSSLESVSIGSSVKLIGEGAFGTRTGGLNSTAIGWIEVDDGNKNYLSIDGVLYRMLADNTLSLMFYPLAKRESMGSKQYSTSFEIPDKDDLGNSIIVSSIEKDAFAYTGYLKEVVIGDTVTTVGTSAFAHSSLIRIHLGAGVQTLGTKDESNPHEVFLSCGALESITVDGDNVYFTDIDGVLYDKVTDEEQTTFVSKLLKYPAARNGSEYIVPETIVDIMPSAFEDADNLKRVTITSSLRSVGENAFVDCSGLSVIHFKGVTAPKFVGQNAFTTFDRSLTELLDPRTTVYYDASAYDDAWADLIEFRSCKYCGKGANGAHNGFHFAPYEEYAIQEERSEYYTLVLVDKKGNPINDVYVSLTDANGVNVSKPSIGGIVTFTDQYDQYGMGLDLDFDEHALLRVIDNRGEYFPVENADFYLDEEMRITYLTLSSVPSVSGVNVSYEVDGSKIKDLLTGAATSVVLGEGKKTVDINSENAVINKWCVSSLEVLVSCYVDFDATVSGYQVLQGNNVVLSVSAPTLKENVANGKRTVSFTITLPTEHLLVEEELYLTVNILDGSEEMTKVQTQLKIKIISLDFKALDFSFLGEGQTLKIDPKLEEIFKGFGKELPLFDKWNIEVAIEINEDSFRVAIGGGSEKTSGIAGRPEESLTSDDFKDFFKLWSVYKDDVKNKGGVTKTPFSFEKERTVEKRITGFLEVNYKGLTEEGKQDFEVISGVTGSIGFTKSFGATYYFVFVPVRLDAELSAEGSITFKFTFDREAEQFITPGIDVQFEGGITLSGGIGVRFASIGLYGSLKMVVLVEIAPEFELKEWSAEGDLGFYVKYDGLFVKWKFTHSFVNGKLYIYKDGKWLTTEGTVNNLSKMILNQENYVLAESARTNAQSGDLSSLGADTVENAYEQSSAKSIRVGDKIYLFYYVDLYALGYGGNYDNYNYQKIVYQVYDLHTERMTEARVLDDNGYADGAFTLSSDGEQVTILFSQLSKKMTAEMAEDLSAYLAATELKAACINADSATLHDSLTTNGYYEMFPTLAISNGQTMAIWAENRENTLFGTTEQEGIALYKSVFDGGVWSEPICLKEGIGSITDLAVCGDRIGYITDDNNDLATVGVEGEENTNDRRINIIDSDGNHVMTGERSDAYHDLSVLDGSFVYYLGAGLYKENGDLIVSSREKYLLPEEYTVLVNEQGETKAILFLAKDENKNSTDVFAIFYDAHLDLWGDPVRITDCIENEQITSFDAVDFKDRIYLSLTIQCQEANTYILERGWYDYPEGVTLEEIVVDEEKTTVTAEVGRAHLTLKIINRGYKTLDEVLLKVERAETCLLSQMATEFFDENGTPLEGGLGSGKTGYVKLYFEESKVGKHSYTVSAGESQSTVQIWYSDLQVSGKQIVIGAERYIVACVTNQGLLTSENILLTLSYKGQIFKEALVKSLESGKYCHLQISVKEDIASDEDGTITLRVASEEDRNIENNESVILLSSFTDDKRTAELKQILESTRLCVDLLAPDSIYLAYDSAFTLEQMMIGQDCYDRSSGVYRIEGEQLVVNGAFLAERYTQGVSSVSYSLIDPEGQMLTAETELVVYASYQEGDINGDHTVSISDVTVLLNYLASSAEGKQDMITSGSVVSALIDVNEDGAVSISDVTCLLNILSGTA